MLLPDVDVDAADQELRGAVALRAVRYKAKPFRWQGRLVPGTERAIGATRYLNIDPGNRNLEIGGTWYGLEHQGTGVNAEAKYLLLRHAFESLGCLRVQLKTDLRNIRSQRAIERLGAVKEGLLRKHMTQPGGYVRDSLIYSIIDDEWPAVKSGLEARLEQGKARV